MTRPKGSGGIAKELTAQEIKRIDKCLAETRHEHRNRAIFFLGLGSGMRISEIVNLRIKDVRPYGQIVDEIVLEKHTTKANQSRTVAISEQAKKHLQTWFDTRGDLEHDTPVFPSQKHPRRPMRANYAVQLMSKIFKDAGVPNASSHSMRRTLINRMDKNGERIKVIQEQVGHANLATTQKYLEVSPDEKRRAVRDLKF